MARAVRSASVSTHRNFKHGAVIEQSGRILSYGANKGEIHAEQAAILSGDFDGATLYSARITNGGHLALAKPCAKCMIRIRGAGIRRVFYTISDTEHGEIRL